MAKSIKRFGLTPRWGLGSAETTDLGTGTTSAPVLFATSISWDNETDEFVQKNHLGQDAGLLLYDARLNWSLEANVNHDYEATFQNYYAPAEELVLHNSIGKQLLESQSGFGYDPDDATSILKTVSINETNDGATTLSLGGTIYYFSGD